ncbi:MAG: CotH kinase family protein [Planctomycetes bacterium]|nr:CotH kinase family protein [Planctomycetota bacterium]
MQRRTRSTLPPGMVLAALLAGTARPAGGQAVRADDPPDPPDPPAAFEAGEVFSLRLEVPEPGLASLREDPRRYVRATLAEGSRVYANVGVRVKGGAGSFRPVDSEKPGFTVKVNQFVPSRRFRGLRKLLLNNCVQDPSYLSETLGNEIFLACGVPAPRTAFARVRWNGRDLGLYVLVEAVTRDFLGLHFESPDGGLYEGPGEVTDDLDEDSRSPFLDRLDLKVLARAAAEPDPEERWRRLSQVLDVERFISFVAAEAFTWHWDGYVTGVNNYRVYADPSTGRAVFLPHGADQLFQDPEGPIAPETRGLVANAALSTPEGRELYARRLRAIATEVLDEEALRARVEDLSRRVRPVLAARSEEEVLGHDAAREDLLERIGRRFRSVAEQLAGNPSVLAAPLDFDAEGAARLSGWRETLRWGEAGLEIVPGGGAEGGAALKIAAAEEGCIASWRVRVLLGPGRYRLEGKVRTIGVVPLADPETDEEGLKPGGASVRVSGQHPPRKLRGTTPWRTFAFELTVGPAEGDEAPVVDGAAELVCDLRAERGEAWFDLDSLRLVRR